MCTCMSLFASILYSGCYEHEAFICGNNWFLSIASWSLELSCQRIFFFGLLVSIEITTWLILQCIARDMRAVDRALHVGACIVDSRYILRWRQCINIYIHSSLPVANCMYVVSKSFKSYSQE